MRIHVLILFFTVFLVTCATPVRQRVASGRRRKAIPATKYRKYERTIPGSSVRVIQASDGTYQVDEKTSSQILTWLVARMKTYINETGFDANGFSEQIISFRRTLRHLDFLADGSARQDFDAMDQFAFAKRMYVTMRKAKNTLEIYEHLDVPGSQLLCKIIELSVRALALYNTLGGADIHVPQFSEKLMRLSSSVLFLDRKFRDLAGVSIEMHMVFERYIGEAESAVSFLGAKLVNAS
ncbi:hypothetical protein OXX69_009202 [Metschnikowia pulcherrima]